jgi:hypothetical protein
MLIALMLLAASPTPAAQSQTAVTTFTPRAETEVGDSAVPLDWAGPAARRPGADANVQSFDPAKSLFGEADMCVVLKGQPLPACATRPQGGLQVTGDVFTTSINPDATCQTVEDVRLGADGKPQRVFATVCGDEAESWAFRQRSTPSSRGSSTRPGERTLGPNDTTAPRNPS